LFLGLVSAANVLLYLPDEDYGLRHCLSALRLAKIVRDHPLRTSPAKGGGVTTKGTDGEMEEGAK